MTKYQIITMIIDLAGGLALLLFAVMYINDSLQKAAGQKFRGILTSLTSSRPRGLFSGFFLTSLNQSGTATMFLAVGLVGAGLLSFIQYMAVSLGAAIGATVIGHLVAFRLSNYALAIVAAGYAVSFASKKKRLSQFGDAIFAFGVLFFAMKLMADGLAPLSADPTFLHFIEQVQSPFIGIAVGIVITIIMQSSGAVVGMIIALASARVLYLNQAIYMALGSQLGTCITIVLASFQMPRTQKRAVLWQVTQQVFAIIIVFPFLGIVRVGGEGAWIAFVKWLTRTVFFTEDIARQVAVSHTMVAVFNALIILPFLKYFEKFVFILYPFKNQEIAFGTVYIDSKNVEKNIDKALELSKSEIKRTGEFVLDMLGRSVEAFDADKANIAQIVSSKGSRIELLQKEISSYLAKIIQRQPDEQQAKKEIELLSVLSSLGEMSDVIDRNLMYIAKKKVNEYLKFSDAGFEDIEEIHSAVYSNAEKALTAFDSVDKALAAEVVDSKTSVRSLSTSLRQKHIARLHANLLESVETSVLHMDVLDQYSRINAIVTNIASTIANA